MSVFTSDPDVVRIGGDYLHVDGFILPVYIVLFAMNALLQALKRPMVTVWIGLYRQGFSIAIFCYLFVRVFDLGTWGVWFGIAVAVTSGLVLSLIVAERTARGLIGGLFTAAATVPAAGTKATDQNTK